MKRRGVSLAFYAIGVWRVKARNPNTHRSMFGTFTESALLAYAERATEAFKEKRIAGKQGTEHAYNEGIGEHDHSFIDADESQDADDYSEHYDFTTCLRPNGTLYGIGGGKCRKGTEVSADAVARLKQERKSPPSRRSVSQSVSVARPH